MFPLPPRKMNKVTSFELKLIGWIIILVFLAALALVVYLLLTGSEVSLESYFSLAILGIISVFIFIAIRRSHD